MNSGDWIENLSALEYVGGKWKLYRHGAREEEHAIKEFLYQLEADQYEFSEPKRSKERDLDMH
jgi:hypothetical protein